MEVRIQEKLKALNMSLEDYEKDESISRFEKVSCCIFCTKIKDRHIIKTKIVSIEGYLKEKMKPENKQELFLGKAFVALDSQF
jgi:hypothetical protein